MIRALGSRFLIPVLASLVLLSSPISAQQLAKRLILKDGSYQLATKWEVHGERVRYFSAERSEWEEVPASLVDWAATEKYQKERAAGVPLPEAMKLDKELAAERVAEEAKRPEVAPGLRLPADGGVLVLDTFENQPQLVPLEQNSGEINTDRTGSILRAAINPVAGAKESIEVPGPHAKAQVRTASPIFYVRMESADQAATAGAQSDLPWDRFRIVRMQAKPDKRVLGNIKVAVYGKVSQEQKLVPTSAAQLSAGWVKLTLTNKLAAGEYAVVELLGEEGINLYVWDFGVNPQAAANPWALKPEITPAVPSPGQPPAAQNRPEGPNKN
jgi:hypothetical protein